MGLFGFGNKYPYTDFHELNLDWILSVIRSLQSEMQTFVNVNTIKYADPILWDISSQYEQNTLVQDSDGITYLSKIAVPAGISINNTDYWLKVADFSSLADIIKRSIASADDGASATSTDNRAEGDLVWLNNYLYKVLRTINIGDAYIEGGVNPNIEKVTVEELINAALQASAKDGITASDDGLSTTSTANRAIGDLVWLNNVLYEVITPITAGDTYTIGTNINTITVETLLHSLDNSITINDDGSLTTSTQNRSVGDLVWLNNQLYEVISAITAGDAYVIGTNVQAVSIEDKLKGLDADIQQEILDRIADINAVNYRIDNLNISGGAYINIVTEYNAVGDGVTDNTQIINDAIDDISSNGGGTLYFPAGVYLCNDTIYMKSDVSLIGDGDCSIIKFDDVPIHTAEGRWDRIGIWANGSPDAGVSASPTTRGTPFLTISSAAGFSVGDLIEVYSTSEAYNYQGVGDGAHYGELAIIESISGNVFMIDHPINFYISSDVYIRKVNPVKNISIENLHIMGEDTPDLKEHGIYLTWCQDVRVRNCKLTGFDWYSIGVTSVFNAFIESNNISGVWYDGATGSIFYGIAIVNDTFNAVVTNNIVRKERHLFVCVSYTGNTYYGVPVNVDVGNNIAYGMEDGGGGISYAYEHHGAGTHIVIHDNIAMGCYSGANIEGNNVDVINNRFIWCEVAGVIIGDASWIAYVNIKGNIITPVVSHGYVSALNRAGILLEASNVVTMYQINISDNVIVTNAYPAIYIESSVPIRYLDISNNQMINTDDSNNIVAIHLNNSVLNYNAIRNNLIENFYEALNVVTGKWVIKDNTMIGHTSSPYTIVIRTSDDIEILGNTAKSFAKFIGGIGSPTIPVAAFNSFKGSAGDFKENITITTESDNVTY